MFKQRKYLVHGGFGSWSAFSECSQTCGSGTMHRSRTCSNPEPREESVKCPVNKCQGKQKGFYLITVYPESLNKVNFFMVLV